jgi:hypothetical protein
VQSENGSSELVLKVESSEVVACPDVVSQRQEGMPAPVAMVENCALANPRRESGRRGAALFLGDGLCDPSDPRWSGLSLLIEVDDPGVVRQL